MIFIIAVKAILFHAVQNSNEVNTNLNVKNKVCKRSQQNVTCELQQHTVLLLLLAGQTDCFIPKQQNTALDTLKITTKRLLTNSVTRTLQYTRSYKMHVTNVRGCPRAASC